MCKAQVMAYAVATVYLIAEIWNIMKVDSQPFWVSVVNSETKQTFSSPGLLNIIDIFTTLVNCLFFFVIAVVCMQATQTKSVTSAMYFKQTVKVGFAAITCFSGLTLLLGAIMIGRDKSTSGFALILWIVQVGLFLGLQLWILFFSYKAANSVIAELVEFH